MSTKVKKNIPEKGKKLFLKHERDVFLILIPLVLGVILGITTLLNDFIGTFSSRQTLIDKSVAQQVTDYSSFTTSIEPPITAEAAIIMDSNSKVITYVKNPTIRFSMASTTKLMTALVALEHYQPKDILTVISAYNEGVVVGFEVGEQIYFEDALYAMLLPSGNDAANVIAQNYPGGEDAFIAKMNRIVGFFT